MRIAIFTDTFHPNIDGIVTTTINMAKGLAKKGHKIYIIAPKAFGIKEFKFPGIKVKRVYGVPALFYKGYKVTPPFTLPLFNYIIKNKIDLIHFQTPVTLGMNAIIMAKLLNIPIIGTFHTWITHPEYRKHMSLDYNFAEDISWSYIRGYYNRCDLITTPSEETKKLLIKNGIIGEIKTISNGINPALIYKDWQLKKRDKTKHGPSILFVGRIAYEKNVFYLLECFKNIVKKMPSAKLIVIGDGPQMQEFKEKIESLKLGNSVKLVGKVEHSELMKSKIFDFCNVFVTASLTETQGITLLEAQAKGLVGVGVSYGGTKDLIKNGYNGFLVKKGDKNGFAKSVIKLLSDNKLYLKMRKNSLNEVKKHNLNKIVNQWEKEYSEVINKHRKTIIK